MTVDYVLITPACNEEASIEKTILAVLAQSRRPKKWVIVDDGSTDATAAIAADYAKQNDFIHFCSNPGEAGRDFSSKVHAIRFGCSQLGEVDYQFIGNLDADVTFGPLFYSVVLNRMEANPKLGIAGGTIYESIGGEQRPAKNNAAWSVPGAVQTFRRECYEAIGGYRPMKYGGEDGIAGFMARRLGWSVLQFEDLEVFHHRRTGAADKNPLQASFHHGRMDYSQGIHPVFELGKFLVRLGRPPYVLGASARLWGYLWDFARREERPLSDELIKDFQAEQLGRLQELLMRRSSSDRSRKIAEPRS